MAPVDRNVEGSVGNRIQGRSFGGTRFTIPPYRRCDVWTGLRKYQGTHMGERRTLPSLFEAGRLTKRTITGLLIVATVSLSGCEAMMQDLKGEDPNVIAERECNSILEQSRLKCIQDAVADARPIRSDAEIQQGARQRCNNYWSSTHTRRQCVWSETARVNGRRQAVHDSLMRPPVYILYGPR
jgi:hypothetical protein